MTERTNYERNSLSIDVKNRVYKGRNNTVVQVRPIHVVFTLITPHSAK